MNKIILPTYLKTILILISLFVSIVPSFASNESLFKIYFKKHPNGQVDFYAKNGNYCPYQFKIEFSNIENLESSVNLPFVSSIEGQQEDVYLFSLTPKNEEKGRFNYKYVSYMGKGQQATVHNDDHTYVLPYEHGTMQLLTQGYHGKVTHHEQHALDFKMKEGTPIHAARAGVVVSIKQDSKIGGRSIDFLHDANFVTVYHEDGTFADYLHMQYNGSSLKIGDVVKVGQLIGYSGNTGYSSGPHLHFQVYVPGEKVHKTFPVHFYGNQGRLSNLKEMTVYRAINPEKNVVLNDGI